jgi:hypothetical protein
MARNGSPPSSGWTMGTRVDAGRLQTSHSSGRRILRSRKVTSRSHQSSVSPIGGVLVSVTQRDSVDQHHGIARTWANLPATIADRADTMTTPVDASAFDHLDTAQGSGLDAGLLLLHPFDDGKVVGGSDTLTSHGSPFLIPATPSALAMREGFSLFGGEGRTRTDDLRVMSPPSCRCSTSLCLSYSIGGDRGEGSNPPCGLPVRAGNPVLLGPPRRQECTGRGFVASGKKGLLVSHHERHKATPPGGSKAGGFRLA